MHKIPLLLSVFLLSLTAHAQPTADTTLPIVPGVVAYDSADVKPKAGFDMNKFLADVIRYPDEARENDIQGQVMVRFVINENGRISDVVIARSPHPALSAEVLRIMKQMPEWSPAMRHGTAVKVYFYLPISFKLEGGRPRKKHRK